MRIKDNIQRTYILFLLFFLCSVSANAATPMNSFKEMIESGTYTIKYEVQNNAVQDMQRKYSQDTLFDNDLALGNADNLNSKHFLTVQGQTAYGEHITLWGGQNNGLCYLQKEDKVYEFMYANGKYLAKFGGKAIAARPMSDRKKAEIYGYEFLDALKPIFPDIFRSQNDYYYTFRPAGEGTDKEGRTYYDYEADFSGKDGNYLVLMLYNFS